jgi:hypothetical protein
MKLRILSFLRRGLPLSSQDLEAEWLVVTELRSQKLEEITELLSISPDADADEVLRITKWWRETGDISIPGKLKNYADRLRREFHSLNELSLEILDELGATFARLHCILSSVASTPPSPTALSGSRQLIGEP